MSGGSRMHTESLTVMVTSAGSKVAPMLVQCLKTCEEPLIRVVGVDASRKGAGSFFCDAFHSVPYGTNERYANETLQIAVEENVNVVIPGSDEEVLALSQASAEFRRHGIVVACSSGETTEMALDKLTVLSFLKAKGIATAAFRGPRSLMELERDLHELRYPGQPVVFKPRRSRGRRGFWVVSREAERASLLMDNLRNYRINADDLLHMLANAEPFPEVMLMEYLPGADFNVDLLAKDGECLSIIPNERIEPEAGPVEVGLIREDRLVSEMARQVAAAFRFDYLVNVEMAYPEDVKRGPLVYEINPRVSAPIAAYAAAGVNLLLMAVLLAAGCDVPRNQEVRETQMIRYSSDLYVQGDRTFRS
ncbi:MAG: hypothetical protein FJZ95_04050 [Chloroflexi bacterium]|nr:hypothetical protein [Chloroflexota bacterium]